MTALADLFTGGKAQTPAWQQRQAEARAEAKTPFEPPPAHLTARRRARADRDLTGKQQAKTRRSIPASGPVR